MKQLLIRADDIGYSYAVNLGIARAVNEGPVRSVGLMPNMPEAARGWEWVKDASSREFRAAWAEGREIVETNELVIEIEAQLARFRAIVGRDPDYFEAHAIQSDRVFAAIHDVAKRHGLKEQPCSFDPTAILRCGATDVHMVLEDMLPPEQYDPTNFIHRTVESMADGETYVTVFHPGYLDQFILANSSLTVNRTKEVDALIDPSLRAWLEAQPNLKLVDYRDL